MPGFVPGAGAFATRRSLASFLLTAVVGFALGSFGLSTTSYAVTPAPHFERTGPDEMVFDWSALQPNWPASGCDHRNSSDQPARAIRNYQGEQQLLMSHSTFVADGAGGTIRILGSYLGGSLSGGTLSLDCAPVFSATLAHSPSSRNNYEWLAAPYSLDGQRIFALTYDEYHGDGLEGTTQVAPRAPNCPGNGGNADCQYASIKLAQSTDGGDIYAEETSPDHLVASLPYKFETLNSTQSPPTEDTDGRSFGYQVTSSIVRGPDNYFYAMFATNTWREQQGGTCLMRTPDLADADQWRMYRDPPGPEPGNFLTPFIDPYETTPANPADYTCTPLSPNFSGSLTYSRYMQRYMLVGPRAPGIWYTLSKDLINWENPTKLADAPFFNNPCSGVPGEEQPYWYPSIIDHDSTSRNFETTGKDFYLYLTQFSSGTNGLTCLDAGSVKRWQQNSTDPYPGDNRDLVRIPLRWIRATPDERTANFESDAVVNSVSGFDTVSTTNPAALGTENGGYETQNNKGLKATYDASIGPAYGTFNASSQLGNEIWYGGAFRLPTGTAASHSDAALLRWRDSGGSSYGEIDLNTNQTWRLTKGGVGLGQSFTLPEGQWFWLEVHQRISQLNPLSEVFLNGRLLTSSGASNSDPGAVPDRLDTGIIRSTGTAPWSISADRISLSPNQRGALPSPQTPRGINATEQSAFVTVWWRPVAGIAGYRVYKQQSDGSWQPGWDTSTTGIFDFGLSNCPSTPYRYRITSYDSSGMESVASEPLELIPRPASGCP
jgi:hypothetical protein